MFAEIVLLLALFVAVLMGVFLGEGGPMDAFENSGPSLAARVEGQLETGSGFSHNTNWSGGRIRAPQEN